MTVVLSLAISLFFLLLCVGVAAWKVGYARGFDRGAKEQLLLDDQDFIAMKTMLERAGLRLHNEIPRDISIEDGPQSWTGERIHPRMKTPPGYVPRWDEILRHP